MMLLLSLTPIQPRSVLDSAAAFSEAVSSPSSFSFPASRHSPVPFGSWSSAAHSSLLFSPCTNMNESTQTQDSTSRLNRLPGFRKLFCIVGGFLIVGAVWTCIDRFSPSARFRELHPPEDGIWQYMSFAIPIYAVIGLGCFWFWRRLASQQFSLTLWRIGLFLLAVPAILL